MCWTSPHSRRSLGQSNFQLTPPIGRPCPEGASWWTPAAGGREKARTDLRSVRAFPCHQQGGRCLSAVNEVRHGRLCCQPKGGINKGETTARPDFLYGADGIRCQHRWRKKGPDRSGPEGLPFCTGGVAVRDINWKRPWVRPQSLLRRRARLARHPLVRGSPGPSPRRLPSCSLYVMRGGGRQDLRQCGAQPVSGRCSRDSFRGRRRRQSKKAPCAWTARR